MRFLDKNSLDLIQKHATYQVERLLRTIDDYLFRACLNSAKAIRECFAKFGRPSAGPRRDLAAWRAVPVREQAASFGATRPHQVPVAGVADGPGTTGAPFYP